jgi:hypothetical protein
MFPILEIIYSSFVAIHGLPRMRGYPFNLDLVCRTMKSVGYSKKSIEIVITQILGWEKNDPIQNMERNLGIPTNYHLR